MKKTKARIELPHRAKSGFTAPAVCDTLCSRMPGAEFAHNVFLSHSAKDKAVVRPLAERLRADGMKVWFDEWVLKPGDSIETNQSKTLGHSHPAILNSLFAFGHDTMSA